MNNSKFIYIPIEVKPRELDGKLLIALEAVSRGYSIIFGRKGIDTLLESGPKGVYFYKDAHYKSAKKFVKIKKLGHKVVVHDEEGLVQQSDEDYLKRRLLFNTIKEVETFFCWGKKQSELVEYAAKKIDANLKICVAGHPRIDLLRKPIRFYNAPINKNGKKTVLINTKLAECNHRRGPDGWLNLLKSHNMLHSENCESNRLDQIEYKKNLFSHYKKLVNEISKRYSDIQVIIRPHPSEDIKSWLKLTENLKNVLVTKDNNIGYWLNRSDLVIHTGCSTAIEAFTFDLPVISFKPITDHRFEIPLPDSISMVVNSVDECCNKIGQILINNKTFNNGHNEKKKRLEYHIENISGDFSYKKIVNEIDNIDMPKSKIKLKQLAERRIKYSLKKLINLIKGGEFYGYRDITKGEVTDSLTKLARVMDYEVPKVKKLDKNIYLIYKD